MKSTLEAFSEKIANTVLNVRSDVKEGEFGIDIAAITQLIEAIAQIIMEITTNCPAKSTLGLSVKKPNFIQRIRFRNAVKQAMDASGNPKLKALAGKTAEVMMDECAKLSNDEVAKIVDESENLDNWLI